MCFDFGIVSGPLTAALLGSAAMASSAATAGLFGVGGSLTAGGMMSAAGLVGTALTAVGAAQQGQAQRAAYKANAKIAEQQALDAQRRGSMVEGQLRTRSKLIVGAQRAQQGGSGVVPDTGTGLDLGAETAELGEREAVAARINAEREALGYRTQARMDRFQAGAVGAALPGTVAGTALTSASNMFTKDPWWKSLEQKPEPGWDPSGFDYWDRDYFRS